MPLSRTTVISPHFLEEDAWYDIFVIHMSEHVTMPTGWSTTPNSALISSADICAYFEPNTITAQDHAQYGHRARPAYVLPKYLLWLEYGLRGRRATSTNDVFFGGGEFADSLGHRFHSVYNNKVYDDTSPLFPSAFALACNADHRACATGHVDAFFRRLHQDDAVLLDNSSALSCALPLACRVRPTASLSLMRHVTLFPFLVTDIGAVEVKNGASSGPRDAPDTADGRWHQIGLLLREIYHLVRQRWADAPADVRSEPHTTLATLPLPGFCSFRHRLYRPPPTSGRSSHRKDSFWEIVRATASTHSAPPWEAHVLKLVADSGVGVASPFTRLIDEVLDIESREVRLSFLKVPWLEKLLTWKMRTFGLRVYLTRTALPMSVLFFSHLSVGVLSTRRRGENENPVTVPVVALASLEAAAAGFILWVKLRQLYRIPRLFFRSIFNYIDGTALALGLTSFFLVVSKSGPPRPFLSFSTLLIWIATILTLRIYKPVGVLFLLLTETLQGIALFLILFFLILLGPHLPVEKLDTQLLILLI